MAANISIKTVVKKMSGMNLMDQRGLLEPAMMRKIIEDVKEPVEVHTFISCWDGNQRLGNSVIKYTLEPGMFGESAEEPEDVIPDFNKESEESEMLEMIMGMLEPAQAEKLKPMVPMLKKMMGKGGGKDSMSSMLPMIMMMMKGSGGTPG